MGLKDFKAFKNQEMVLNVLESFGISKQDLIYLPEALKVVKGLKEKESLNPVKLSEQEKKNIEQSYKDKLTPEKLVEQFATETEEFYPNGKPKTSNN